MTARAIQQQDRAETNPAFSCRKLKLGTFQTNLDSGCVMSDLDGRLDITWPTTLALARPAEEMDFEALAPVARWHGSRGLRNLAHLAQSPDRRRQAVHGHRSYFARPLRPQHRDRMESAGNRHVRQPNDGTHRALRLRRGMARHRQAAV